MSDIRLAPSGKKKKPRREKDYVAVKGNRMEFIISEMEDGTPPEDPRAAVFVEPAEAVG
jgi:hypothetical protein